MDRTVKQKSYDITPVRLASLGVFLIALILIFLIFKTNPAFNRIQDLILLVLIDFLVVSLAYTIIYAKSMAVSAAAVHVEMLRESEEKYRLLVENIPSVVWIFDQGGNPVYMSKFSEKICNFTPQEIIQGGSLAWFGRINPDHLNLVKQALDDLFAGRKDLDIEFQMKKKDGAYLWLRQRSNHVYDNNGQKYATGIIFDNTKYKEAADQLKSRTSELERINATMIGREIKMADLKKENEELRKKIEFTSFIKGGEAN